MAVRARPGIVTSRPHLVLSHIGDDDRLPLRSLADGRENTDGIGGGLLAFDSLRALFIARLPRTDLLQPRTIVSRSHSSIQSRERYLRVGDCRNRRDLYLMHLRRIDIDVDKARMRSKRAHITSDAIIKAQSHADD